MTLPPKQNDKLLFSQYKAPDGGWGWVIVFSSLIIHLLMDGITYSLGTYLTVFIENFEVSHAEASFVHSLLPAVTLSCGPVASMLTNKLGCRLTTVIGSLIASFGFFLSSFVTKFFYLYLTIGVIVGFGFGLIYVPAIVAVGYYFEKKRSLAIGIAVCGSGLGTFILSPLNRILFENYGCSGAFLIKSALCLNLCVCGCLMRPVAIEPSQILKRNKFMLDRKAKDENTVLNSQEEENINENLSSPQICVKDEKNRIIDFENSKYTINNSQPNNLNANKNISLTRNNSSRLPNISVNCNDVNDCSEIAKSMPLLIQKYSTFDNLNIEASYTEINNAILQLSKSTNSALDILAHVKSLQNIPLTCYDTNSINEIEKVLKSQKECNHSRISLFRDKLKKMIDFTLFKDILFIFFVISNFLTSLGFNVPYIYIVDQATLLKIKPEHADLLLSTIGISNSIGRLILGFLGDLKNVNRIYLYSSVLAICGIVTIIEPFCNSFILLFTYSVIFGLTSGGYVSLTSVLIVDLLGLEKLTNAFGILLVFQGVATSIGPPLVGIMFDKFHSYLLAFIIIGLMIFISGSMCYVIPLIQYYLKIKQKKEQN